MKKWLLSILFCLCILGAVVPAISTPAEAAEAIPYIDADGNTKTVSATQITSEYSMLEGWYYVSGEVTISDYLWAKGDAHIILTDGCKLKVEQAVGTEACIRVGDGHWLSIYAQSDGPNMGKLEVYNGGDGAGIGSANARICGTINIFGGDIAASSASNSAAIGGGSLGNGGMVNISGGRVKAISTGGGAAIGGGYQGSGGTVNITGGTVVATSYLGAGIGGGNDGAGGVVNISGGTVTASSTYTGAGIGSGGRPQGGTINISGGKVIATSESGAGIGGGSGGSNSAVNITGGTVTAESKQGAGIGGGSGGDGGIVLISGGTVTARSTGHPTYAFGGAGIGGGVSGSGGTVIILGGSLVVSSKFGEAIGHGDAGSNDHLHSGTLTNGTADVYLTTVTLSGVIGETEVRSISGLPYNYGSKGMKSDASGQLYLYLPAGTRVTDIGTAEYSYRGSVSAGGAGTLNVASRLSSVSFPEKGIYTAGKNLEFKVTYSTSVTVTGRPYIPLTIGSTPKQASYVSGSGTPTLVFRYTIQSSDLDTDGIDVGSSILLNGGSIKTAGVDAYLDLGSIGDFQDVIVGTDNPTVTINTDSPNPTWMPTFQITVNFSESVGDFTLDDLNVVGGSARSLTGSGSSYTANIMVSHFYEGIVTVDIPANSATDLHGKGNTAAKQFSLIYDQVQPKITSVTPANGAANVPVSGAFVINFSEAMNTNTPSVELTDPNSWLIGYVNLTGTWSNGNKTYTVSHDTLLYNQDYTLTIFPSYFSDLAGNNASWETQRINFTTETEPLIPTVSRKNLTIGLGETESFSVALGQGSAGATEATITADDGSKLSITPASLTSTGTVSITGLALGTTEIIVNFNDRAHTQERIGVIVDVEAPSWPDGSEIKISQVSQSTTTLTWTAASDPGTTVAGYKIYQDGILIGFIKGTTLSYTVIGLLPSTSYNFQVQAGNTYDIWSTDGPIVSVETDSPTSPGGSLGGSSGGSSGGSLGGFSVDNFNNASVITDDGTTETIRVTANGSSTLAELTSSYSNLLTEGRSINISTPEIDGVTDYSLSLPASGLSGDGKGLLTVTTGVGSVSLPSDMLTGTAMASGGKATFTISGVDPAKLPEAASKAVATRPLVSLSLSVDGERIDWNNPNCPVTVSIPYTPLHGEDPNAIIIWYIDGDGYLTCVTNGRYVPETGTVSFSTTHFSHYSVGYNPVRFADVSNTAWYHSAVTYLAARNITSGTSDTTFSPNTTLSRGQFITLLLRTYGIEADSAPRDNFADGGNTYYTGYLATAKRLGISSGIGGNNFAPEQPITRQDMFTLLYKSLNIFGQLSKGDSGKTLSDFLDHEDIAPYAQEAMAYLMRVGTLSGSDDLLSPKASATRAQITQVLYHLLSDLYSKL